MRLALLMMAIAVSLCVTGCGETKPGPKGEAGVRSVARN